MILSCGCIDLPALHLQAYRIHAPIFKARDLILTHHQDGPVEGKFIRAWFLWFRRSKSVDGRQQSFHGSMGTPKWALRFPEVTHIHSTDAVPVVTGHKLEESRGSPFYPRRSPLSS
ncbi:hypothetical protein Peur_032321 [Populus x canadensis]